GVEVATALPGGDPFIVTSPIGRGRSVFVAPDGSLSSVDPTSDEPWPPWPTWPSYLPIVRELLSYATGGQHDRWQQLVGSPLSGKIAEAESPCPNTGKLQMVRPDGRTTVITTEVTANGREWHYADTGINGVYT